MLQPGRPLAMLVSLLAVAALALTAHLIGALILRRLRFASPLEGVVCATLLGLGVVAHAFFLLGLCGLVQRATAVALLGAGCLASLPALGALWRWLRARPRPWLLVALFAALAVPVVMVALRPPTTWDATMYHLAYVREYVRTHQVHPAANLRFTVFPQLNEMLFTLVFLVGGEPAPGLVELLLAALTGAAIVAWALRVADATTAAVALGVWVASPMVLLLATVPYIDMGLCAFCTASALAAGRALESDDAAGARPFLALCGALAGFAAGVKYTGLMFGMVMTGVALLGWRRWRLRGAIAFGAVALAAALPWYVYDAVHTGNPICPYAGRWLGRCGWSAADLDTLIAASRPTSGASLRALLELPHNLTFHPEVFLADRPFPPLFLFVLVLVPLAWRLRWLRFPALATAAYGALWLATSLSLLRYLMPASALFALAAGGAFVDAARRVTWMARFLRPAALAALLCLPSSVAAARQLLTEGFPLSVRARHDYLARQLPAYDAWAWLNANHPEGYLLYALFFDRMFYFANGTQVGDWFGPWRYADFAPLTRDPPALAARLRARGVGFLLLRRDQDQLGSARDFVAVWSSGEAVLYQLSRGP